MADVIPFPVPVQFSVVRAVGVEAGITVSVVTPSAWPHDLFVALDGTFEGRSVVMAVAAGEVDAAETVGRAVLATLEAARLTWADAHG